MRLGVGDDLGPDASQRLLADQRIDARPGGAFGMNLQRGPFLDIVIRQRRFGRQALGRAVRLIEARGWPTSANAGTPCPPANTGT